MLGPVVMCGDFHARCGELIKDPNALPRSQVLDVVKNRQGEDLMGFLGNIGMRIVNGRSGKDGFTCVSGRGEEKRRRGRRRQPWFTKEIGALRKEFHKAEGVWLCCRNADDQRV